MQMNTAISKELRQRPQLLWQAQKRRLAHGRVFSRESELTTREQSTRRRAATRNVQLAGAINARPSQQPAFLPNLQSEPASASPVRFPNVNKTRLFPPPLRANVCRPVSI